MEEYYSSSLSCGNDHHVYKKKKRIISSIRLSRTGLRKGLFHALLLLGFVWLLLVNVNVEENYASSTNNHEEEKPRRAHRKLDFINVVSKRKVPKGPDPIHNRRAGNSHQPPGRA